MAFIGLPVSRYVDVEVNLSALLAQSPAINTFLVLSDTPVIDTVERMRSYATLGEVALDFGTSSPEYAAAVVWFGQSPQPQDLKIGRWASAAAPAQLIGGGITAPNLLVSAWNAITNGGFFYTSGATAGARSARSVTGLNFSAAANLNAVAAIIQAGITAAGGTATIVYNSTYNRFEITSSGVGPTAAISFLQAPTASGNIAFAGQPAANDTITLNGTVITFVAGAPAPGQVQIGGDLPTTLTNLLNYLSASQDTQLVKFRYSVNNTTLYAWSAVTGTGGNALTLAKSGANITVSAATLTGGSGTDISGMMSDTAAASGVYAVPGIAAETAITAVSVLDNNFGNQWYGLFVIGATDSDHEQVAAYIEASNPKHFYAINTQEAGVLVPSDTSDIGYILSTLKYNKSAVQYSGSHLYAAISMMARILTTPWLGQYTTLTLMYKQEPGVVPENLNTTQANAIQAKNVNVYVNVANGTSFLQYGQCASGQFIDTVVGADWLAGEVQTEIFNALSGTPTKIPQTDAGVGQLLAAANRALERGVNNGYLAPGQWNSAGFGTLTFGKFLGLGYYAWAPPIALQAQAVRQQRLAPVIQIAAKNAGAIHTADVVLNINQ